jgi:hypothetical protein
VYRLVDHDHAGAVVPGVPAASTAVAMSWPTPASSSACPLLAAAAVSITCLASAWLSA